MWGARISFNNNAIKLLKNPKLSKNSNYGAVDQSC